MRPAGRGAASAGAASCSSPAMPWPVAAASAAGVPTGPTALPTPTAAPNTATRPRAKAASLTGVDMSGAGHLVAGLLDGGTDSTLVDGGVAGDGAPATGQVDVDGGDAGELRALLGDGGDAVAAGQADDGVAGGAHRGPLRGMGGSGTDEARDGLGGFTDLLVGLPAAGPCGLDD